MDLNDDGRLTRSFTLPFGLRATFSFSPTGGLRTDWEPDTPQKTIRSDRAWNKFYKAYVKARDEFMAEVATLIGGPVLTVTMPDANGAVDTTISHPHTRH
jgi:hypothetical protein